MDTRFGLLVVAAAGLVCAAPACAQDEEAQPVGYTDTPFLPGGKYRVHDPDRPHPQIITPGAQ